MSKSIDCLLIGHNDMNFREYEREIRKMGVNSGAYRDLNLNYIKLNNEPYSISEVINLFYSKPFGAEAVIKPFSVSESFSAAIAYLGSFLHRRGLTFDFVNSFQSQKSDLVKKLEKNNILTIAIITTLYVSVIPILEIFEFIKKHNRDAKIILGGPFISTQFRNQEAESLAYLLETTIGADFYVNSSQGETALVNIIKALKNRLPLKQVSNLYYKEGNKYISTTIKKENNKINENMVDWELFKDQVGGFLNVRTSISCPFSCAFCGFPEHAGTYQTASVDMVEKELKALHKIKGLKTLHFVDDTFNVPLKRFKEILRMMIRNQFEWRWHSFLRCQYADREMVELLKESRCEGVYLGIESGNDQILNNMNKGTDTGKYLRGIQLLKEYGIVTFGNFIIGFPGETEETVQDTIDFIDRSQLDFYRVQLWYCEPVTPIYREREKYEIKGESFEWSHTTMNSLEASDLVEEIFLTQRQSIWMPQYNFDFDNMWHLIHRGIDPESVKGFLKGFNNGVREKLRDPYIKDISSNVSKQLINAFRKGNDNESHINTEQIFEESDAEFDF
jgi:anaerobic magnesium-protoporphyrin IX monomethyl ester cyclase